MPKIDVVVETAISQSVRAAQVSSMFDVPAQTHARLEWRGVMPIEAKPWQVGLIVGPSGSGKSTILRHVFDAPMEFDWTGASVIDAFDKRFGVEAVTQICMAVGFNTIPAWLRPYHVLSNGEKFRVDLARRLLEGGEVVVCDEFTSVVDRQVARIGAHAVQKYIRKANRQFIAATCHYDVEDWLQPDWVLEPAGMTFRWRVPQRRPDIACRIEAVPYDAWHTFARFHYMSADLNRSAKCFQLLVDDRAAAFCAVLYRPHPRVRNIYGMSRLVTLPDFQGLGLAFALCDRVAAAYKARGFRYRSYPAHPGLVRAFDRSAVWRIDKKPGLRDTSQHTKGTTSAMKGGAWGGRPCAIFEYSGPASSQADAACLLA